MNKVLLITVSCLGFVAASSASNAADRLAGVRSAGYVAPQVFSLRRSYPGYRPIGTEGPMVACPLPNDLSPHYLATTSLLCRRQ
jgi:hypothetical protein